MAERIAFEPNHDEASRQAFVASMKKYINFDVETKLGEVFEQDLVPGHAEPVESRDAAEALLEQHPLYQL